MKGKKGVIILGSARGDGNTRKIVNMIRANHKNLHFINLCEKKIGYFDYEFRNQDDDFIPLMSEILEYEVLIFATPVYWYSMSGILKNFFDRITDLLEIRKDLGRRLNGKTMMSISCGSNAEILDSFSIPFSETAKYLKMNYWGHTHTWINAGKIPVEVELQLEKFLIKLR
ncbi:MAG: NAD(P)H-dependent oxidoreductase [Bacteroidetes bacterium]|nr:NAD(P)H-dependent oxidoreductase [Bacteroidota bacterium]